MALGEMEELPTPLDEEPAGVALTDGAELELLWVLDEDCARVRVEIAVHSNKSNGMGRLNIVYDWPGTTAVTARPVFLTT